jgi:hypothetical protein
MNPDFRTQSGFSTSDRTNESFGVTGVFLISVRETKPMFSFLEFACPGTIPVYTN